MNDTANSPSATLERMTQALQACTRGELPLAQLTQGWRAQGAELPLPPRFGQVLGELLDRLEAGALFSEESCSFSQKDLLANLQLWAEKARAQLKS